MKKRKKNIRFRIQTTYTTIDDRKRRFALQLMLSEKKLTPLIIKKNMDPGTATLLIALHTDATLAGNTKSHQMTEYEMKRAWGLFISLWKEGLFVPSKKFPYTLEQVLEDCEQEENGEVGE